MRVVVVETPEPLVFPEELPGNHASDDLLVEAMIAGATANIDGPGGWLGRSIGVQTLEALADGFCCGEIRLLYGPVIDVVSVTYRAPGGVEQILPEDAYRLRGDVVVFAVGATFPSAAREPESVRVRYRAGYGRMLGGALQNDVPAPIKAAIILMTVGLLSVQARDGGLRSFEAPGVGTKQFNSPELMDRVRTVAVERLLAPFRVYA